MPSRNGNRQSIRIFFGYQLVSQFHSESDIRKCARLLVRTLSDRNVRATVTFGRFPAGENLWDAIRDAIGRCDVALFDISENNPNVVLEAGLALGSSKRIIMLKSRESDEQFKRPSDLVGYVYVPYRSSAELCGRRLNLELSRSLIDYLSRSQESDRLFKGVWGFGEFDDVTVVCSQLDEPEERQHPEPWEFIYLSKYGDLDALFEAQSTIHELYPNVHVEHRTGTEISENRNEDQFTGNLVLVGGPDYNRLVRTFERYSPVKYFPAEEDNNITIRLKRQGTTFTPRKRGTDPEEIIDYGFFVSRRNPHNLDKRLILVGGCHTYGVYGAIKAFRYSRRQRDPVAQANCRTVLRRLGPDAEFFAFFEVHGVGNSVPTPRLDASKLWSL